MSEQPSSLPTLAEVKAYMLHWHGELVKIAATAKPKPHMIFFHCQVHDLGANGPQIDFGGELVGTDGKAEGKSPEAVVAEIIENLGPEARAAQIAKLRAEADKLEREVAA
jgi:hypothetical protein